MSPSMPLRLLAAVAAFFAILSVATSSIPVTSPMCKIEMRFPSTCQSLVDAHHPKTPRLLTQFAIEDAIVFADEAKQRAIGAKDNACSVSFDDAASNLRSALGYLKSGIHDELMNQLSATLGALQICKDVNEGEEDVRNNPVKNAYTKFFRLAVVCLRLAANLK